MSKHSTDRLKTRLILKPGQRGTKTLTENYGDSLVCVRYRHDPKLGRRMKTVELVVETVEWTPPASQYQATTKVPVRIAGYEVALRAQVKAAGGRWNPEEQLWFVDYGKIAGRSWRSIYT